MDACSICHFRFPVLGSTGGLFCIYITCNFTLYFIILLSYYLTRVQFWGVQPYFIILTFELLFYLLRSIRIRDTELLRIPSTSNSLVNCRKEVQLFISSFYVCIRKQLPLGHNKICLVRPIAVCYIILVLHSIVTQ